MDSSDEEENAPTDFANMNPFVTAKGSWDPITAAIEASGRGAGQQSLDTAIDLVRTCVKNRHQITVHGAAPNDRQIAEDLVNRLMLMSVVLTAMVMIDLVEMVMRLARVPYDMLTEGAEILAAVVEEIEREGPPDGEQMDILAGEGLEALFTALRIASVPPGMN